MIRRTYGRTQVILFTVSLDFCKFTHDLLTTRAVLYTDIGAQSLIRQSHSRGQMQISEDAMILLLSRLGVFSGFTHILSKFKLQTSEVFGGGIACNGIYAMNWKDALGNAGKHPLTKTLPESTDNSIVFETAYILKHVENNERKVRHAVVGPWSIRQMAIYQQCNATRKISDCLLIQTSARVKSRITGMIKNGSIAELPQHWTYLHEVYFGTLSANWEEYFAHIEKQLSSLVSHSTTLFPKCPPSVDVQ